MANKDTCKQWFETNDYPTAVQFAQVFEWLRWKDEDIKITDVEELQTALQQLQLNINNIGLPSLSTVTSNGEVVLTVPAGKCMEYIIIDVVTTTLVTIGSVPNGNDIYEEKIESMQPIGLYKYFKSTGSIYINGLPTGTVIKYKIF